MAGTPSTEKKLVEYIHTMLHAPEAPQVPTEISTIAGVPEAHEFLLQLRGVLDDFAKGDLSHDICLRGVLAGRLKALQANLLHITWQIQRVAAGDFTQRVDFMGDFSAAFNSMVEQLDASRTSVMQKEEELTRLTLALQDEVAQKGRALAALKESEASFRYMAEHDALTGILNRRSFEELALVELKRAKMMGYHCALALFDVDHFKKFNDTYGHIEGDRALKHVTGIIASGLRQGDIFARYGGEEFVGMLSLLNRPTGDVVIERLRKQLAKTPITTEKGDVFVTASVGMVIIPPNFGELRDVQFLKESLSYADAALYEAKESGRNRLIISSYPEGAVYGTL